MEHWPDLVIVGANHKSAPLALRERLMVEEEEYGRVFARHGAGGAPPAALARAVCSIRRYSTISPTCPTQARL